jgi:hypothetical protein
VGALDAHVASLNTTGKPALPPSVVHYRRDDQARRRRLLPEMLDNRTFNVLPLPRPLLGSGGRPPTSARRRTWSGLLQTATGRQDVEYGSWRSALSNGKLDLGPQLPEARDLARAARKLDQYAARKVGHLKAVHSTLGPPWSVAR